MLDHTVTQPTGIKRHPGELNVGDRIAAGFMPSGEPAEVLFTTPYRLNERDSYVLVVSRTEDGAVEADHFREEASIPVEALADDGLAYTRADTEDDPTPVSPARVPLHTGSVVADGVLVTDPDGSQ